MIEVLKQWLEALETYHGYMEPLTTLFGGPRVPAEQSTTGKVERAITSIRQAIAELESQEPVCPECKAEVLYECVACSRNNYPPQRKPLTDEQMFDLAEIAWRHGWASCRDAEYIGEEAEDERWGMIGAEVVQNMAAHGIKE